MKRVSENISAVSIVDRYLEHARVFIFYHGGEELIYLSSADWMVRNLSYRVETTFPVYSEHIRNQIKDFITIQLSDNVKARIIDRESSNEYRTDGSDLAIRAQMETYYYIKRQSETESSQEEEPGEGLGAVE